MHMIFFKYADTVNKATEKLLLLQIPALKAVCL